MRDPDQTYCPSVILALATLTCAAVGRSATGQVVLPDSEEPAADQVVPISTPEPVAALLTGPEAYREIGISCHAARGIGGAPALGDRNAWAGHITRGMDTLTNHAMNGFSGGNGIMPM